MIVNYLLSYFIFTFKKKLLNEVIHHFVGFMAGELYSILSNFVILLLLLFASSSDFFPLINPVVPGLGRRTPDRVCWQAPQFSR